MSALPNDSSGISNGHYRRTPSGSSPRVPDLIFTAGRYLPDRFLLHGRIVRERQNNGVGDRSSPSVSHAGMVGCVKNVCRRL